MRKYIFVSMILALALACSNEPSAPSGSLPDVQNLRIDQDASRGDTVVLVWDALEVVITSYNIYYSTTVPGDWGQPGSTLDTTWTHIATSSGYYQLKAQNGTDYSAGFSNRVDTRAETGINEREMRIGTGSNGLVFYEDGTGWGLGCADSMDFAQDIYIDTVGNQLYLFSGNADPATYPGGNDTKLCRRGLHGRVAPEPGSTDWLDSVQVTDFDWVFVQLSNDHYAELYIDSVFTDGADLLSYEYQMIDFLRLFNVW